MHSVDEFVALEDVDRHCVYFASESDIDTNSDREERADDFITDDDNDDNNGDNEVLINVPIRILVFSLCVHVCRLE